MIVDGGISLPLGKAPKITGSAGAAGAGTAAPGSFAGAGTPPPSGWMYGGFPDPYAQKNIFAGLPTTVQQTPYGSQYGQLSSQYYTPSQLRNTASQQTRAQISSQLAQEQASYQFQAQQLQAQQNRAAGLAAALGSFGPQYAQQAQGAYDTAAQTLASIGQPTVQAAASGLQSAQDAAAASVAAKTGGQGQVASPYNIQAIAGNLQGQSVDAPANSLVQQGYDQGQLGYWGSQASEAQVRQVADYYGQQQVQALAQRTADRSQIIAQQPQLYQQALEQQKQDNLAVGDRLDQITSNAMSYIQNLRSNQLAVLQASGQYGLNLANMTHVNPYTGQVMSGYTQLANGGISSNKDAATMWHYYAQANHWGVADANNGEKIANAAANKNQIGSYSAGMSSQTGYLSDANGRQFKDAKGNPIPYQAPVSTSTAGQAYDPKLSAQTGYLMTKTHQFITDPATGQPLRYSSGAAGGGAKPLTTSEMLKQRNAMSSAASAMQAGVPATTKSLARPALTMEQAIQGFNTMGYFSTPQLANAAMTALGTAYKTQVNQSVVQNALQGYNAYGGDISAGAPAGQTYAPGGFQSPAYNVPGGPSAGPSTLPQPTLQTQWNRVTDPVVGYLNVRNGQNLYRVTKSGLVVNPNGEVYQGMRATPSMIVKT